MYGRGVFGPSPDREPLIAFPPMGTALTWSRLAELPVEIDGYTFEELELDGGFRRLTTTVRLTGGGLEGRGEDVTYSASDQEAFRSAGPVLPLAGGFTLEALSAHLDLLPLWTREPELEQYRPYRRWAFESAALDLALRQARTSLGERLGIAPRPVRFVASSGLGTPPSLRSLERLLARAPGITFKVDTSNAWDAAFVRRLADFGRIEIVDFKGAYRGTPVDQEVDPALYARVIEGLPECWLEDPAVGPRTEPLLEGHWDRVTWDAVIHDAADVRSLAHQPRRINVKPSRAGTLERLFGLYDHCRAHGIEMYGGGQFELGVGRTQLQTLAALFHPEAPNDVAPVEFHDHESSAPLPASPLEPPGEAGGPGFR